MCPLFRTEDYLPPKDEPDADYPDQEEDLAELLFSKCPRCDQVGVRWYVAGGVVSIISLPYNYTGREQS